MPRDASQTSTNWCASPASSPLRNPRTTRTSGVSRCPMGRASGAGGARGGGGWFGGKGGWSQPAPLTRLSLPCMTANLSVLAGPHHALKGNAGTITNTDGGGGRLVAQPPPPLSRPSISPIPSLRACPFSFFCILAYGRVNGEPWSPTHRTSHPS